MSDPGEKAADEPMQTDLKTNLAPTTGYKVLGETNRIDATGVVGRATSGSGLTYGVVGETNSDDADAAGILAKAPKSDALQADARGGSGHGILSYADSSYCLYARQEGTGGDGGPAIFTRNLVSDEAVIQVDGGSTGSSDGIGLASLGDVQVEGTVDASEGVQADAPSGYSIQAVQEGTSGDGRPAIFARNMVTDQAAIEVDGGSTASSDGIGLASLGNVQVEGTVDASRGFRGPVGSSAFLSSNYSLRTTFERIPFESLHANQRNEFSSGDHWFECAYDGTYQVELGLESSATTSGTVAVTIRVDQGSAPGNPASQQGIDVDFQPGGNHFYKSFTKTIYGLQSGNRILAVISDSAGNAALTGGSGESYLSVRQVGGGGSFA